LIGNLEVAIRIARRGGLWIRVFPDKPVTIRAAETRIGSGKGNLEYWVAVVRPGQILFELRGVSETSARRAMQIATSKLPIKTRFIIKILSVILILRLFENKTRLNLY
jgi:large subunit ribosomal protein L16